MTLGNFLFILYAPSVIVFHLIPLAMTRTGEANAHIRSVPDDPEGRLFWETVISPTSSTLTHIGS